MIVDVGGGGGFGASSVFFSAEITLSRNELRPAAPDIGGVGVNFDFGFGLLGPTRFASGLILRVPEVVGSLVVADFFSELLPSVAMASAMKIKRNKFSQGNCPTVRRTH